MNEDRLTTLRQQVQDGLEAQQAYKYLTPYMKSKREGILNELSTQELSSIRLERAHVALRLIHDLDVSLHARMSAGALAKKELDSYDI